MRISGDLIGRTWEFLTNAGVLGLFAFIILVMGLLTLTALGKTKILLYLFLILLMFSGFAVAAIDSASTLLRWTLIFLLGLTAMRGAASPGPPAILLGAFAVWGIVCSPIAPSMWWAIQRGGLLLVLALPAAAAIARGIDGLPDIIRMLKGFLVAGGLYVVLGLATLPSLMESGGERFSGAGESAPLFVMTGGLILPVALWGALNRSLRSWRWFCVAIAVCTALLCVVSGQRTGTFAGFIGCIPLLMRFGLRRVLSGAAIVGIGIAVVLVVLSGMPEQADFVYRRFTSADTTGRIERWLFAVDLCLQEPFFGHGIGANMTMGMGFHNAFLTIWYDGGLLGLALFLGAFVWQLGVGVRLAFSRLQQEYRDLALLLLGLTLALIAGAFFESKLDSPSNIAMFMAVFVSLAHARLRRLLREQRVQGAALPDLWGATHWSGARADASF
jgi:O-antigen ligase